MPTCDSDAAGQQAAHEIERLRAHRARVRGRPTRRSAARKPLRRPRESSRRAGAPYVSKRSSSARLVGRAEARVAVVAVAEAVERRVVRDVARRLLEVGGEPRPLQDLRQQVRRPLARDVRAAELRDRVVAVAEEDPLVELGRALALGALDRRHLGHGVGELVEEQAAQRARVARVAREQRALHRLRQVDEAEDRPVEVREVRREALALLLREALDWNCHAFDRGQRTAYRTADTGR